MEDRPGAQAEHSGFMKLRRRGIEFMVVRVPEICKAGHWRGRSYTELGTKVLDGQGDELCGGHHNVLPTIPGRKDFCPRC